MISLVLLTILTASCANTLQDISWKMDYPQEVADFIEEFKAESENRWCTHSRLELQTRIRLIELKGDALGMCYVTPVNSVVYISSKLKSEPILLRTALWHELGHCLFNMSHSPNKNSIMYAYLVMDSNYWESSWADHKRLFFLETHSCKGDYLE